MNPCVIGVFDELKSYNYLISCDYYPLTDFSLEDNVWVALQYDSPERAEGCAVCFRRANATFSEAEFKLNGIDPNSNYKLIYLNSGKRNGSKGRTIIETKSSIEQRRIGSGEVCQTIKCLLIKILTKGRRRQNRHSTNLLQ